jgi:hypothetical protein
MVIRPRTKPKAAVSENPVLGAVMMKSVNIGHSACGGQKSARKVSYRDRGVSEYP